MRISTKQIQDTGVNAILDRQADLSRTQLQLATGKRFLSPSEDPTAASRVLDLERALAVTSQYRANGDVALSRLQLEESVLTTVTNNIHRVRELAVQGANASQSQESRRAIAVEVRQLVSELLENANTRDANGEYLFAGYQGLTRPFSINSAGGYDYYGDEGQRFLQVGPSRQVAVGDSGTAVFRAIHDGNGVFATRDAAGNSGTGVIDPGDVDGVFVPENYTITFTQALPTDPVTYEVTGSVSGVLIPAGTAYQEDAEIVFGGVRTSIKGAPADGDQFFVTPSVNQDLFTTVDQLAQVLETAGDTSVERAGLGNAINRFLVNIDQALSTILESRTAIGARINVIESQDEVNETYELQLREAVSSLQDLDYAEATSRMNLELVGLQAAQQSFVRIQGLSLFNFLR